MFNSAKLAKRPDSEKFSEALQMLNNFNSYYPDNALGCVRDKLFKNNTSHVLFRYKIKACRAMA